MTVPVSMANPMPRQTLELMSSLNVGVTLGNIPSVAITVESWISPTEGIENRISYDTGGCFSSLMLFRPLPYQQDYSKSLAVKEY